MDQRRRSAFLRNCRRLFTPALILPVTTCWGDNRYGQAGGIHTPEAGAAPASSLERFTAARSTQGATWSDGATTHLARHRSGGFPRIERAITRMCRFRNGAEVRGRAQRGVR